MFCWKEIRIIINSCCSICLEDDGVPVSELQYVFQCNCQYIVHKKCFDEWLAREPKCLICGKSVFDIRGERCDTMMVVARVLLGICLAYIISVSLYNGIAFLSAATSR